MKKVSINGATIAFHDETTTTPGGAPLLLLHGFAGTALSHLGGVIDALEGERRIIAPDLRGYGASRPPARDFPLDFYQRDATDMCALLDALELRDIHVAGFSDGGEVALLVGIMRPDLVRSVFAWGVCGIISPEELGSSSRWLPVEAWGTNRAAWRQEIIATQGADQLKPMIEGWVAATRSIAAAGGDVSLNRAHALRCPALLMNGDGEVGNPLRAAQALVARFPKGELQIVRNSGHAIHNEQPDIFLAALKGFLQRWDNASPSD